MTRDFSEVMNTLSEIQDYLLQVAIYNDFKPMYNYSGKRPS